MQMNVALNMIGYTVIGYQIAKLWLVDESLNSLCN